MSGTTPASAAVLHAVPITYERPQFLPLVHYFNQPWSDVANVSSLINRWQNRFLNHHSSAVIEPAVDIIEGEALFRLYMELPGINENDIDVTISRDTLSIKGRKRRKPQESEMRSIRRECAHGIFQRCILLPDTVQPGKAEAFFGNGVLTIDLPKKEKISRQPERVLEAA